MLGGEPRVERRHEKVQLLKAGCRVPLCAPVCAEEVSPSLLHALFPLFLTVNAASGGSAL